MPQPAWKLDCLTDWSQVWEPRFAEHWQGLSEHSDPANVFFTIPLVKAWTDTYRRLADIEPRFLVGRDEAGNEALLPMVLFRHGWRGGWLRSLEPVGANEFDYHDPLITESDPNAEARRTFWSAAATILRPSQPEWDVLRVPRLRLPPPLETLPLAPAGAAPFIDLSAFGSFEAYMTSRPSQERQELKRRQRRLSERGVVELKLHGSDNGEALQQAIERLAMHRRSRWPNAYEAPGLLGRMADECLPSHTLQVAELWVGDRPIAWRLTFAHRGVIHCYLSAFDPQMASYSPSKISLARLIEAAMGNGFSRCDLLSGREPYKTAWQTDEIPLSSAQECRPGAGTRIRVTAGDITRWLASVRRRHATQTSRH